MESFKPMLFTCMKNYSKEQFFKDLVSGIIVAIIALPLSIALALASGVGPEPGLYTAIVAGFLISFFGGSTVQIAGPTAAFATIVAGIIATDGMDGLIIATIMAGIILIILGLVKAGALIKFIPYTITTGFTAGIAVTILIGQFKDFFGVDFHGEKPIETIDKLKVFFSNIDSLNVEAMVVGIICLAVLIIWPKFFSKIPASIIAVFVSIAIVQGLHLNVNTIGTLYPDLKAGLPSLSVPHFSLSVVRNEMPNAFTIAILAAIESLLSAVVADGMVNSKHRSNQELIGQGIGNIGSVLFGGIPATGAIARTAANIKNGGRTPVAGMVHSITLLIVLVVLMPYAKFIPMPCIAAILFQVAYNMCQWRPFVRLVKYAPKSDIIVLVLTFILTVVFDLVVAIEWGMIVACILFIKRMSEETQVSGWTYQSDEEEFVDDLRPVEKEIRVFEITGPLFFGVSDMIANDIDVKHFTKVLVIRMRSVPAIDVTALRALKDLVARAKAKGVTVVFSHVNEQPRRMMEKADFINEVGRDNFAPNIDAALDRAEKIIGK
ncbi:SulP family inorganic anion transporter [Pseudobutyrivibrio sp.]|uniref:SulP family inorganic anion transporter n=1 Tax=Pseudobutyrivibrio sp. TaxID=2014367 RepID=UPI001B1EEE6E|nr:SulP family inorganic anion transporter [Pseudobutyrivibrio sp.]MBO5616835.1 STAS domain-containing protein [Pseudobutyrivibrio sp.]MBP3261653.1 STAS domain-containing protein [Pseudobutyrivibrio sp.]